MQLTRVWSPGLQTGQMDLSSLRSLLSQIPFDCAQGRLSATFGNRDKALALLQKAYEERSLEVTWFLKADLRIDNLRSDPRFQAPWRRVGFPA